MSAARKKDPSTTPSLLSRGHSSRFFALTAAFASADVLGPSTAANCLTVLLRFCLARLARFSPFRRVDVVVVVPFRKQPCTTPRCSLPAAPLLLKLLTRTVSRSSRRALRECTPKILQKISTRMSKQGGNRTDTP